MKFQLEEHHRNTSDKELIDDLRKVANLLGKDNVTLDEYNSSGRFHSTTLTRRFGSWFKCLELADLKATRSKLNIPNEELFENLLAVWTKLGRQPRYSEMCKPLSEFSSGTYENRFGSWGKTLQMFIEFMNEGQVVVQPKEIGANIRRTQRQINLRLRFQVLSRDKFKCKICGKSPATDSSVILHVDHIKAWANGGETILDNLQTLCSDCNYGKSDLKVAAD